MLNAIPIVRSSLILRHALRFEGFRICKLINNSEGIIVKIRNGIPDFNEEIHEKLLKDGWRELKEPKSLIGTLILSTPFMIINFLVGQLIMGIFIQQSRMADYSMSGNILNCYLMFIFIMLAISVVLIIVHELIHSLFIPNFIKSDNAYIGFTYFGGYVYTKDVLTKYRLCLILIAPFVFLSVILNMILGVLGLYNILLMVVIILNSIGSSVDILGLTLILLHVPKGAYLTMNGLRTYWKNMDPILTVA